MKSIYDNAESSSYLLRLSDLLMEVRNEQLIGSSLELFKLRLNLVSAGIYSFHPVREIFLPVENQAGNQGLDDFVNNNHSELSNDDLLIKDTYLSIKIASKTGLYVLLAVEAKKSDWTELEINLCRQTLVRIWAAQERCQQLMSLKESEQKHRILFHSMDEGYCIIEMIHNEHGLPIDWRFIQVNPAFERHNGLRYAEGKTIKEMTPNIEQKWMYIYDSVAQSGKPLRFEQDSVALGRIFSLYAFRMQGDNKQVAVIFTDITAQRNAEAALDNAQKSYQTTMENEVAMRTAQLQTSKAQLQSVFDTTLVQLSIYEAVRDDFGKIVDFEIKLVNKELERETGRTDLVGKNYVEEFPPVRDTGLFDLLVKAVETGQPQQTEYCYPDGEVHQWYACMFVSAGQSVIASYLNITSKKHAEQERYKNHLLLRQSERLAMLGSWDYHLSDGQLNWSSGMYQLFDLEENQPASLSLYLAHATDKSRGKVQDMITAIQEGQTGFQQTFHFQIAGQLKVIQMQTMLVTNEMGQPERVLGTDIDVSAAYLAQEKLKRLEAERQREIVKITFSTLEEERRRISESLHNGLAQVLYAVKISLNSLSQKNSAEAFNQQLHYAQELLSEAIAENRRISHELMPPILEEFGLSESIRDIAKKLHNQVKFTYRISGNPSGLEKYVKLAIYRTVQELMLNVVKHAKASSATVEVAVRPKRIMVRITDDGCGMTTNAQKTGIGLASIRSKIKLLNGNMEIKQPTGGGTQIQISFPLGSDKETIQHVAVLS